MVAVAPTPFPLTDGRVVTLRTLVPGDYAAFVAFCRQIGEETTHTLRYPGRADPTPDGTTAAWLADAESPHNLTLGAFAEGRLLGFLKTRKEMPDHPMRCHAATFGMMMLQEVWGQGLGKKLLALQDEHAAAAGITRLEASVRAQNTRAIALYKSAGFKIDALFERYARIGGEYVDEYAIVKFYGDAAPAPFTLPTLATARLVLRPLTLADAPGFFRLTSDPDVVRYTGWNQLTDEREARAYLRDSVFPRYAARELDPFCVAFKTDPARLVGTVGAFRAKGDPQGRILELAYAVERAHWGKGLAVEAASALIAHAFAAVPDLARIQAHCDALNPASARVMEKLGLRHEGTFRQNAFLKGAFRDTQSYAMLRADYRESQA